jgi:hypothetical protein
MILFSYILKCYISVNTDSLIFPLMVADILLHFSDHFLYIQLNQNLSFLLYHIFVTIDLKYYLHSLLLVSLYL